MCSIILVINFKKLDKSIAMHVRPTTFVSHMNVAAIEAIDEAPPVNLLRNHLIQQFDYYRQCFHTYTYSELTI